MKKKILITLVSLMGLFFGALIILPLIFESKIGNLLKENVNTQINGKFDFDQARLSLISSFPKAQLGLEGARILNTEPFEGDTLFYANTFSLEMGLGEIFKGAGDPITIKNITIDGAKLNLQVNAEEQANYDIAKENPIDNSGTSNESDFSFSLSSYAIRNAQISYSSSPSKMNLGIYLQEHVGSGDLSLNNSKLDTRTRGLISLQLDSIAYLWNTPVDLKALIGMDLEESRYQFLYNQAMLKDLPLVFEGEVLVKEDLQEIDIRFDSPEADFKDFVALLPEAFVQDMDGIEASGDFKVSGFIKGISSEESIPGFNIGFSTINGSVQYRDLQRPIDQITLDAALVNNSGTLEGTQLEIKQSAFNIGQDRFQLEAAINDILGDKKVKLQAQTKMNLGQLSEAYPLPEEIVMGGNLDADISTSFAVSDLESNRYSAVRMEGFVRLANFVYSNQALQSPLELSRMTVQLVNDVATIQEGSGKIGNSDFKTKGSLQHLLGYALGKQVLEGNLDLRSGTFLVADFVNPEQSENQEVAADSASSLKIPTDIDLRINAVAGKIVYDDLVLKDFRGKIRVNKGTIYFQEVTSDFFEGKLALQGSLNTLAEQPQFALALDMEGLQIRQAFESMELLQALAPVAGALKGKFSSQVELAGTLNNNYTPDLPTLSGAVLAEILTADVQTEKFPVLTELNSSFDFFDTNKLDLRGLKTALAFEDGKVNVKPFNIKYDDILVRVDGGHGFDRSLDYELTLDVPAKYLGNEIQNMIASIGDEDLKDLSIPVKIGLAGTHTSPRLSSDISSGVKSLTNQLVELQKQRLINKGSDKAKSLIGGILGNKSDSTEIKESESTLGNVLKGLSTKPKDSSTNDSLNKISNPLEEKATGLLKGLLKGKKKDTTKTENQ